MPDQLVDVAVNVPLSRPLTYLLPNGLNARRGDRVEVPVANRKVEGILLGPSLQKGDPTEYTVKEILRVIDSDCIDDAHLRWMQWLSDYYVYPVGQVISMAFPPLPRENKNRKSRKAPTVPLHTGRSQAPQLTQEQESVLQQIELFQGYLCYLLHGVTGSGKTEIYIRLFQSLLQAGKTGLLLIPEISLTPQLVGRFVDRLGDDVAVIHSHLTPREKTNQWYQILDGKKRILIGARSALFCPVPNLGLIVIDEEHEPSFKQEEKLRYHARDAAVKLAHLLNIPILLGSATPSLEAWENSTLGKYRLLQMRKRVEDRLLPEVQIVDLRNSDQAISQPNLPAWLSQELFQALSEQLQRQEQSALFLNRRGVAPAVFCSSCGLRNECPNCSVSLTLHGRTSLVCHYCAYSITSPEVCTSCGAGEPKPWGSGTEQIENDIKLLFPRARTLRMDRDEIQNRDDLESSIRSIEEKQIDILIGTQMIAKGLDFPGLTLVGIVLADMALSIPDFRSGERCFQLLTQVAGRSGRHLNQRRGQVILQTFNPDHPSIVFATQHDFEGFAKHELQFRKQLLYPPFSRLGVIRLIGGQQERVSRSANALFDRGEVLRSRDIYKTIQLLGPVPCALSKVRNQFRWQILVKSQTPNQLSAFCRHLTAKTDWLAAGVRVLIDIDAMQLL